MKKVLLISAIFISSILSVHGQYINLSDDPILFIDQADSLLKQWGNRGDSTSGNFGAVWNDLSGDDQQKVIVISLIFRDRKYRVIPFFTTFYDAIYNGLNGDFSDRANITEFLDVAKQVVEGTENGTEILRYLITSRNLYEHGALFYSKYNKLNIPVGSSFKFQYVEKQVIDEIGIPDEVEQGLTDQEEDPFGATEETDEFGTETEDDWNDDDWGDDDWSDDSWDDDTWADDDAWGDDEFSDFDDNSNMDNFGAMEEDFDPFASTAPVIDLPPIEGAHIVIENADFEFMTPYDTFELLNTSGTYVFGSRSFVGDTGIMPIDIPFDGMLTEAEVTFGKFAFNTRNTHIKVEDAELEYQTLFDQKIKGSFSIKSVRPNPDGPNYPVFRSYKSNFNYKGIGEGISLKGGFTLLGDEISTIGQDLGKNYIEIEKDNKLILKGHSQRFFIQDTVLNSHKVNLVIYESQDSLYHPSMGFSYNLMSEVLSLYWEAGHFKHRPMVNTFHEVEIVADKMTWDLNTREIDFSMIYGRSEVPAKIRSMNNFDNQEYIRIKGLHRFHPVQVAAYFAMKQRRNEFSSFELAEAYKINPKEMKNAIIGGAGKGYLDYDEATGLIKTNYKTFHAYKSNFKKTDFDNMEWFSISPNGKNATYLLDSGHLVIRGIDREIVSKELGVYYKPDSGIIVLQENRDFIFDGEIKAGNYSIKGKDFDFSYDDFHLHLTQIDSINFDLTNDSTGESSERQVLGGSIEHTSGMFYLNEPNNKSGRKHLPQYPILDVQEPSYVYFDDPDILGGAYDRRIYFEIPKFKIDTLESDNPSVINFEGTFHSGGVIPDFQTTLGVNEDLSLGFEYDVPAEGFTVFENEQTKFYNKIFMNKNGLNGNGTFEYLTSTTDVKNVTFYQDSMVVHEGVIDVKASEEYGNYPDAQCADAKATLMAANDRYIIESKGRELVHLYDDQATLKGAAMISPKGMFGIGDIRTEGTDSRSNNFKFSSNSFVGRDAEFFIEAYDADTFALSAHNAKLYFDFEAKTATLEPERKGEAVISLPLMFYKTSIPVGTWDLEKQTFTMTKPADVDIEDSYFYSTLEDQDSLAFNGASAVYDAVNSVLTVKEVPGIHTADAYITPGDSTVIIDGSALIQPLIDATIVMNATDRYHFLTKGEVDIYDRHRFDALAEYQYVNSGLDTLPILFDAIYQVPDELNRKNKDSISYGEAYIEEDAFFYIAPKILYQGDVKMYANREFLAFDGEIRLDLKHTDEFNDWLPFVFDGDPNDIRIELKDDEERDESAPLLTTGIHVDGGESQMYYTFLSSKRMEDDPDIFRSSGLLAIDADNGQFEIGAEDRLSGEEKRGNLFIYNDSTSIIQYEGEFNLYGYLPQEMEAKSYGKGRVNIDSGNYTFNTLTYLEFPIPNPALREMGYDMSQTTEFIDYLPEASKSSYELISKLTQMIGERAAEDFDQQLYDEYLPLYMASGKFSKSILFADLKLKWHSEAGALYSGDSVGLASVGKDDINGRIRGYYEIKKLYEDEIVNLFLELEPDCWYYFSYDGGRMSTFSSNHNYNTIIESKSKTPESGAAPEGEIYLASADLYEVTDFIKYYNETYLGKILSDKDVDLKVTKPEIAENDTRRRPRDDDEPKGGYEDGYDDGSGWGEEEQDSGWGADEDTGWGADEEEEDSGWGQDTEEDYNDGWVVPEDTEPKDEEESDAIDQPIQEKKDEIQTQSLYGDDEEDDSGWGWEEEEDSDTQILGAPPKEEKKKKDKRSRRNRRDEPEEEIKKERITEEKREPETGWGFGSQEEEEEDSGWGFGGSDDDVEIKTESDADDQPKEKAKDQPKKEKKVVVEEEEDDSGWGFGGSDDDVEIKTEADAKDQPKGKAKDQPKKEKKVVVEEEEDDSGWGFGGSDDDVEIKSKADADDQPKDEGKKKIIVDDEEDTGWGFSEPEEDKKEEERLKKEAEKKAKEEAEKKAKEEADRKAKEEAERKKKEEEELKKKEEEEKKRKAEEEKKRLEEEKKKAEEEKKIVVEDEDDSGWGFGGGDDDVEIKSSKEEEEKKAKEEADRKKKEEEERKKKEEEDRKKKEEEEKKKKEEERKKKEEEEKKKKEKEKEEKSSEEEGEDDDWDGF